MNNRYKLKNIYFSYRFDNSISYNRTYVINNIFIFILLLLIAFIIVLFLFLSFIESNLLLDNTININSNSLDYIYANEVCVKPSDIHYMEYNNKNNTIFELFIDLFNNKSNSSYKYFPSYFHKNDLLFTVEKYSIANSIIEYKNIVNFLYAIN
jgi:hypothetical protein